MLRFIQHFIESKKMKIRNEIEASVDEEIPYLPLDIITDILARLPVKSLLKFRCVSKSWLSVISSSRFIKTHLNYSNKNPNFTNHKILINLSNKCNIKHLSVPSLFLGHATLKPSNIDYPIKVPHNFIRIVGSCNGIVCIAIDDNDIYLWNPAIKKSKKLPLAVENREGCYYKWGFGFSECDDDYKVVEFLVSENSEVYELTVMIYSLKTNSWKRIEDFKGGIPVDDCGWYANGKLHFAAWIDIELFSKWEIVSIDLKSEVYGMLEQPNYGEGCSAWTFEVVGDYICVLCDNHTSCSDVWVMHEYGVKESWSKVVSIPCVDILPGFPYSNPLMMMMPDGKIWLILMFDFIVYIPQNSSFKILKRADVNQFYESKLHVESLVSLGVETEEEHH